MPIDNRGLYESSLQPDEFPCILTGYPVRDQMVAFEKVPFPASKDVWSKMNVTAKLSPETDIPNILSFLGVWCGSASVSKTIFLHFIFTSLQIVQLIKTELTNINESL